MTPVRAAEEGEGGGDLADDLVAPDDGKGGVGEGVPDPRPQALVAEAPVLASVLRAQEQHLLNSST